MAADPAAEHQLEVLLVDRHSALLRNLADRLVAVGGNAAAVALNNLAQTTEAHTLAVENTIALLEVLERRAASTPSLH